MNEFPEVGARIRAARVEQGRSLRSVARDLGLSASLLSQIETGKIRPSVRTLYQIVNHLGLSVDDLLHTGGTIGVPSEPGDQSHVGVAVSPVQHAADNLRLELTTDVVWERLAIGGHPGLENLLVTYGPGAASSSDGTSMRHQGWEFAYVVSGALTLILDDLDTYELTAGDSLSFDSRRPHRYINPLDIESRAIFVISHDGTTQPLAELTAGDDRPKDAPDSILQAFRLSPDGDRPNESEDLERGPYETE